MADYHNYAAEEHGRFLQFYTLANAGWKRIKKFADILRGAPGINALALFHHCEALLYAAQEKEYFAYKDQQAHFRQLGYPYCEVKITRYQRGVAQWEATCPDCEKKILLNLHS